MRQRSEVGRKIAGLLPLVSAIVGLTIVIGSVAFFYFESAITTIASVATGMFFLLMGIWYAANPFFRDDREYMRLPLRAEMDHFTTLLRELNKVAFENRDSPEFERARSAMHKSVDRMRELCEQTQADSSVPERARDQAAGS
jgi:hypothetical protein